MKRFVAMLLLLVGATVSWAAAPKSPLEFSAKVFQGNQGPSVMLMWWQPKEGDAPTYYDVYHADGETEKREEFKVIHRVEASADNRGQYAYEVLNVPQGVHTYFVVAGNDDGESDRTRIRVIDIPKPAAPEIGIYSKPVEVGQVGVPYKYVVQARKNYEGKFDFVLKNAPEGMKIDANTGIIIWESPVEGQYKILVEVYAVDPQTNEAHSAKQDFSLTIRKKGDDNPPKTCGVISGTISVQDQNVPVAGGVVMVFKYTTIRKERDGKVYEETVLEKVAITEVHEGQYKVPVGAGTYKVRFEGKGYIPEWFDDAAEPVDGKDVVIDCEKGITTAEVSYAVKAAPEVKLVTVKGSVLDEATQDGLKAIVVFELVRIDKNPMQREFARIVFETKENGAYEGKLPDGINFIAHAEAIKRDGVKNLYLPEYWQETGDVTTATTITAAEGMDEIKFTLSKRETYDNSLSGKLVDDSSGNAVHGKVAAYHLRDGKPAKDPKNQWVATTETNDDGIYTFTDLVPGTYVVYGVPSERPHVPGWYVEGAASVHEWKGATQITVEATSAIENIDIRLIAAKENKGGKGRMRGFIYDKRGGIIVKGDGKVQGATGIPGALIVVKNSDGVIIDFGMSENAGAFELNNIAAGVLTVSVNRIGYDANPETIEIDAASLEGEGAQRSFGVAEATTSVEVPTTLGATLNLYPNPATNAATLAFETSATTADIRILSMAGIVLSNQTVSVETGLATVSIDVTNVPTGMVMVQVTSGGKTFALPLTIVR